METAPYLPQRDTYRRIDTHTVRIGSAPLGGSNPIRLQSMTNTNTMDIGATVQQCIRIIDAGADYVRITAPGIKEAEALREIRQQLSSLGYTHPLVADIHFNPRAAIVAAQFVEKVRINPGNYVDKNNRTSSDYTDTEYEQELHKIRENLQPLLAACRQHGTAIRIGVNHGSLSDRIMSRYGDTPRGMVVSLLEFLEICRNEDFHDIALSIKASNTLIMVQACRMLVAEMQKLGRVYPLHLGVTEAGEGEDGRIKSAVGIGALLHDGIGDTVRVSLTEDPEAEIPVARAIVDHCSHPSAGTVPTGPAPVDAYTYSRRNSAQVLASLGGDAKVAVFADLRCGNLSWDSLPAKPEYVITDTFSLKVPSTVGQVIPASAWQDMPGSYPMFTFSQFAEAQVISPILNFITVTASDISALSLLKEKKSVPIALIIKAETASQFRELRAAYYALINTGISLPAVSLLSYPASTIQEIQVQAAADAGPLFLDGFGDALCISAPNLPDTNSAVAIAFGILQASRVRFTKTEYISCPSCGRTLFNLQETAAKIRERTIHLTGLKIGIMGCIVNGPGEMADADYGYVGAGPGKVNLYKQKTVIRKGVASEEAVEQLIELIKENGDWADPA